MEQLRMFGRGREQAAPVVNVASVPQRSPFRYPGGKTWLIPRIRQWLRSLPKKPEEFVEPFAGGASAALTVAFENLADRVTLVEVDEGVAAVWETVLDGHAEWLAESIERFEVTLENVKDQIDKIPSSTKELAFVTILKNRVYHGGILAKGSGLIKYGENGKGLKSRWYPTTLVKRIKAIEAVSDKLSFTRGDGMDIIQNKAALQGCVFFIDPPYTAGTKRAGRRLYNHNELDHDQLFSKTSGLAGDFLMTYDNDDSVRRMAASYGFECRAIAMKNTHNAKMTELLIGRNLSWCT